MKKSAMKSHETCILTINAGSSSIKFALFQAGEAMERRLDGTIGRIGLPGTNLTFNDSTGNHQDGHSIGVSDYKSAAKFLINWLEEHNSFKSVLAVGHRVVHGMKHTEPELVTQALLDELHRISPYDPEHLPRGIKLIEAFRERHPKLPQLACFDTAFHRTMPRVARVLPIPRRFDAKRAQRHGFHGLSYTYLMEELACLGDPNASKGPCDPRASRQRRKSGCRARRSKHRHQHGLHPDSRDADEYPHRRSRSWTGLVSDAH